MTFPLYQTHSLFIAFIVEIPFCLSMVATQGSNERKAVTCEHKQLDIGCGREEVINVISAMYGRTDLQTCSNERNYATTSCRAKNATEIVRGRCQGKNDCLVTASNSVFGDPCVGTFKYLTVTYKCQRTIEINTVTCEHQQLDITCGRYEVIHVISVTYGRTDHSTCSRGDTTTRCRAGRATEIVSARCQGKHTCQITASNSVFGDPCVGTFKYMIVEYKCQSYQSDGPS